MITWFFDTLRHRRELKRRMHGLLRCTPKVRKCDYYRPSKPDPINFNRYTQFR